jgi:hypothetical protein
MHRATASTSRTVARRGEEERATQVDMDTWLARSMRVCSSGQGRALCICRRGWGTIQMISSIGLKSAAASFKMAHADAGSSPSPSRRRFGTRRMISCSQVRQPARRSYFSREKVYFKP